MVSKLPQEFRRYNRNRNQLRHIFKETQRVLEVISLENFFPEENIIDELLPTLTYDKINHVLENCPAIIVFGQNTKAKASLINHLLSTEVLPVCTGQWRWIKIGCGPTNIVNLTLGLEYEVVENLLSNEKPWITIPEEDLVDSGDADPNCPTVLEVKLNQPTLKDGVQIFVVPDSGGVQILAKEVFKVLPIFIYALGEQPLSNENMEELRNLKETYPYNPVLFVSAITQISFDSLDGELTKPVQRRLASRGGVESSESSSLKDDYSMRSCSTQDDSTSFRSNSMRLDSVKENIKDEDDDGDDGLDLENIDALGLAWLDQLTDLGFINETVDPEEAWLHHGQNAHASELLDSCKKLDRILYFVRKCLQTYLVNVSNYLNDVHTTSLRKFILSAFDMAREIQITPKRIQYAQKKESELYANLMQVVNAKQEELTELIHNSIQEMKEEVLHASNNVNLYHNLPFEEGEAECSATVRAATAEVQRLVLTRLGERVAKQLVNSVNCLRDTFVGTLQRCLLSLEKSYEHDVSFTASDALRQILSAAYSVELHNSSPSLVHSFLERVRQLFKSMPLPWTPTPVLNAAWRRKVTIDVLNSLSPARLARTISTQFRDKVKASHDTFQSALRSLENHYSGKLERTEEQRIAIRKYHAPRLAKLALESTSMSHMVRYGIPHQGKEIGRGQYGVVFACDGWGGAPGPCAVKSVVPPDEKHWNDLAMEFYYTRSIPDHKRIVKLRGSVIDHTYGGSYGLGSAVLLITDRMSRDLYCGIRSGLKWLERIQIAIDVLEGIRYLHSQGLVHRDIKLKNVLLDTENRAKLTDLGFCITEAMMSGSIVGTPVHMAPELLSGHYASSVDVYAFGILFWYICAGHVRLPLTFEQFTNKEQLWTSVRRGIRPERLVCFDEECWNLMQQCWEGEPSRRPLLGAILPVLESIQAKAENEDRSQN
ncbi:dual serine/threonine and tyrosine protein kinase-like [Copidosoma floridanum]|uniref:dual serine/threonine and tyrosine protein kinase-like n=1 Tax=Copidosoma floridanum TaxID=29053 RepID=UPI0006C96BCB|nr:dual serine/threonine and tyrosine protein kinase-like [Copidosoma floridanum]